jgi:hypothetical protein
MSYDLTNTYLEDHALAVHATAVRLGADERGVALADGVCGGYVGENSIKYGTKRGS